MISRIWHGYTSSHNAKAYELLLKEEIFVGIENKRIRGYKGIQLLRRDLDTEVEFTTIMLFDNLESVIEFAGKNYDAAYVPAKAREVLARFDEKAVHCELVYDKQYDS